LRLFLLAQLLSVVLLLVVLVVLKSRQAAAQADHTRGLCSPALAPPRSVQLGARPSVQALMQSQQGGLKDLSWDLKAPGSIVTASSDGSVCVWDAQVGCYAALPVVCARRSAATDITA
jgi:hypothetical protein